MTRPAIAAALVLGAALWAAPVQAQESLHTLGGTAISRDGSLLALNARGTQRNAFVVLDLDSGESTRFVLPEPHIEVDDLVWSQTDNTLLFVTLDPSESKSILPPHIRGGWGTHVWSMNFGADGPGAAKVIARDDGVRLPALSPDGSKVAYFLPVKLPGQDLRTARMTSGAYAVFERDIASGEAARVAKSQYIFPRQLFYDGGDAWLFSADEPAYLTQMSGSQFWSSIRPGAPPGKGTFDQLTSGIKSFRMERGEALPDYPDFKRPWPDMDIAPLKSMLVGVTLDGRPILQGEPGPENTAANQQRNMMAWYVDGVSRVPMRYGYAAIGKAGEREIYFTPGFAEGYSGNTGGIGVDGALKRLFRIDVRMNPHAPETNLSTARLFLYEGQTLILQRDISDIMAKAATVQIAE